MLSFVFAHDTSPCMFTDWQSSLSFVKHSGWGRSLFLSQFMFVRLCPALSLTGGGFVLFFFSCRLRIRMDLVMSAIFETLALL